MGGVSFSRLATGTGALHFTPKDTPPFLNQPIHNFRLYLREHG
jgi:hypothetical protein